MTRPDTDIGIRSTELHHQPPEERLGPAIRRALSPTAGNCSAAVMTRTTTSLSTGYAPRGSRTFPIYYSALILESR